jgi:hypothetical protein
MYHWIVEADIYRLRKALREQPTPMERKRIGDRLSLAEAKLSNARG